MDNNQREWGKVGAAGRVVFAALGLLAGLGVGLPAMAADGANHDLAADLPVAWWGFEPGAGEGVEGKWVGKVESVAGPRSPEYPGLPEANRALQFDGVTGSHVRIDPAERNDDLRFGRGEAITIEAWVRSDGVRDGQNQYLVGKGRTGTDGEDRDNQNWALRLRGKGGEAKVSFLFRSAEEAGRAGEYHRWTSTVGIAPGADWHHVAVSYRFGEPESIRAYVNGEKTGGAWDMGGATTRPPVVDDGEVWMGSAMGGAPASSLNGALDEVAIHRGMVPGEVLASRFRHVAQPPAPDLGAVGPGEVMVEIGSGAGGTGDFPRGELKPLEVFASDAFALYGLPQRYGAEGERLGRTESFVVRMAAVIEASGGDRQLLVRVPGASRLWVDGVVRLETPAARPQRGAHNEPREPWDEGRAYPRGRLGTEDFEVTLPAAEGHRLLVLEAVVGSAKAKSDLYELLVAQREAGDGKWELLGAAGAKRRTAFEAVAEERYRLAQEATFAELNRERRRAGMERVAPYWERRHEEARAYVDSLPPVAVPELPTEFAAINAIDHFLGARLAAVRAEATGERMDEEFLGKVRPVLEEQCVRCHGEKVKGGLRLDSREAILAAGDSGQAAVVPGAPRESELWLRITTEHEEDRMPPKGDGLSAAEMEALHRWIESGAPWSEPAGEVIIPEPLDDLAFLRRLYLDTVGVLPTVEECRTWLADENPGKYARRIDALLKDSRHAGHWVSYWQDVLAENPRIVKPTLNNTGPFRWWLYESLLDGKPFDQMVTELVRFQGSVYDGGAGGFRLATGNDVPEAAKAHVLATAFLGVEMKCARCHDAPFHASTQKDLFSLAAMLEEKPLMIPETSTVPAAFFEGLGDRESLVRVSHDPDRPVDPAWPFPGITAGVEPRSGAELTPRERLARMLTGAENERFAAVVVNRIWQRYFGQGFVEPADDWEAHPASHPELLSWLSREFAGNGYDLRHVSRLILNSAAYRRSARLEAVADPERRFFEAPLRRRVSAEQLVDSVFAATGVPVFSEELTLDVEGWWPAQTFLNFGRPERAWQFVSLSTDRDRPSLALPQAEAIVSVLEAYGWRSNRAEPLSARSTEPNVLQPGTLAHGVLGLWWTRLSDYSDLTAMALEAESATTLAEDLYLRFLTRMPAAAEREAVERLLEPGFAARIAVPGPFEEAVYVRPVREVSWANHLSAEANRIVADEALAAADGPPPTTLLEADWRERFEDVVWSLINAPEMQFLP